MNRRSKHKRSRRSIAPGGARTSGRKRKRRRVVSNTTFVLSRIPDALQQKISTYFNHSDLIALRRVSKGWHKFCMGLKLQEYMYRSEPDCDSKPCGIVQISKLLLGDVLAQPKRFRTFYPHLKNVLVLDIGIGSQMKTDPSCRQLRKVLERCPKLEKCEFLSLRTFSAEIHEILLSKCNSNVLTTLILRGGELSKAGMAHLHMLQNLRTLYLDTISYTAHNPHFRITLKYFPKLQHFDLINSGDVFWDATQKLKTLGFHNDLNSEVSPLFFSCQGILENISFSLDDQQQLIDVIDHCPKLKVLTMTCFEPEESLAQVSDDLHSKVLKFLSKPGTRLQIDAEFRIVMFHRMDGTLELHHSCNQNSWSVLGKKYFMPLLACGVPEALNLRKPMLVQAHDNYFDVKVSTVPIERKYRFSPPLRRNFLQTNKALDSAVYIIEEDNY